MHHDSEVIVGQAVALTSGEALQASDGSTLHLAAQTLCVHGDNAGSVAAVKRIRETFDSLRLA